MSKSTFVCAGDLDQPLEVLELRKTGNTYSWMQVRHTWGGVELSTKKNNFSVYGVGCSGATFILRRQPLALDNAIRWGKQHCFITSIIPVGRLHWQVEAALVEVTPCEDRYAGITFPAVITEKYLAHQQLEPQAVNTLRHVLVAPKKIELLPGRLVEVAGESWPILTAHRLDPWKNEYEIERTVDL